MRPDGLARTRDGDLTNPTDTPTTRHDPRCDGTGRIDGAGHDAQGRPRPCLACRPHLTRTQGVPAPRGWRNRR